MKKVILTLLVLSSFALFGCKENGGSSSGNPIEPSSSSEPIIEKKVTVNFYLDFSQVDAKNVYYTCEIDNGSLISEIPANPTEAPFPEFPVFKGWSKKEVIDEINDLWDFSSDIVIANSGTFNLFGIWVAQGE